MKLLAYKIGTVTFLCNEQQIKEAGSLKAAAEKMAGIKQEVEKPKADKPEK
jgi:hypothetical protein